LDRFPGAVVRNNGEAKGKGKKAKNEDGDIFYREGTLLTHDDVAAFFDYQVSSSYK
jgi:hypothetical protein